MITLVENTNVSTSELDAFTAYVDANPNVSLITGPMAGINARLLAVNVTGDQPVIMVNPRIVSHSDARVVYLEPDSYTTKKMRKTVRYRSVTVDTDNMQEVEFSAEHPTNSKEDMFSDVGLLECVWVQRGIDMLDGIDVKHPSRLYSTQVVMPPKEGRNQRTMLRRELGEFKYVKNKKLDTYINSGWQPV